MLSDNSLKRIKIKNATKSLNEERTKYPASNSNGVPDHLARSETCTFFGPPKPALEEPPIELRIDNKMSKLAAEKIVRAERPIF